MQDIVISSCPHALVFKEPPGTLLKCRVWCLVGPKLRARDEVLSAGDHTEMRGPKPAELVRYINELEFGCLFKK